MSGDVQPRKRKDKQRRKRDERKSEGEVNFRQQSFQDDDESSHGVHITKMGNDDVHLHVHHEHGTGGHWCAKIIFFSLMAVLLGLVGLIIMENRGLTDLDTPLSESRFQNYFDGWVEEHPEEHDAHDAVQAAIDEHEDHDEPFEEMEYEEHSEVEEEEEEEEEEDHETDGDHDEDEDDEEKDDEEEDIAGENVTVEATAEEEEDDEEDIGDDNDNLKATAEEDEDDENVENAQATAEEDDDEEDDNRQATAEDDDDDADDNDDDDDVPVTAEDEEDTQEKESVAVTAEDVDDEDDAFDDVDDDDDDEIEEYVEQPKSQSQTQSAHANEDDDGFDDDDADDDTFESLDQVIDNDADELLLQQERARQAAAQSKAASDHHTVDKEDDHENDKTEEEDAASSWVASLAVKIGVGVALALVSRLVLIRKNPNTTDEPMPEACMRRRLTIATAEDNIPDDDEEIPLLDDEYSEEEIEIEEEIEVEISDLEEADVDADADAESDNNIAMSASYVPETFEQLNAMYKSQTEAPTTTKEAASKAKLQSAYSKTAETATKTKPAATTTKESAKAADEAATDIYVEYDDGDMEDYAHDENDDITDEEDENDDEYAYELDEGDISDVDDTELMNRLEAKYGRLPAKEYETEEDSDDPTWTQIKAKEPTAGAGPKAHIYDEDDSLFDQELRRANAEMIRENHAKAMLAFNKLIQTYAHKPAAHLARARALELIAEAQRSNQRLLEAIEGYKRYLAFEELITNDTEYRVASERCIEHLRFMGYQQQTVATHEQLIARFPDAPQHRNQLSVTYLMANNLKLVKLTAAGTLQRWPNDAVAKLHYGLALKQLDGDYKRALPYLQQAVNSLAPGTQEGYFYFALGETLQRLSRQTEALEVYKRGAALKFFPSVYQRSLYNVQPLRAQPFWTDQQTGYAFQFTQLQRNWRAIRDEALALLSRRGYFEDEAEQLRDTGQWQQYELYAQGRRVGNNCQRAPITCSLVADFTAASRCRRGQIKFSVMQAHTHVWPHCGPTNCRLRAHLTLVAPEPDKTSLRVAEQQRTWREGELFIFDDSFEHEVWHNGTQMRLVLIVDVWHPDLSEEQQRSLSSI